MRAAALAIGLMFASLARADQPAVVIGAVEEFAPGIVSTEFSDIRLTLSPDGRTALWFCRNRPGGPGAYDIWMSRRPGTTWQPAEPVPFNSPARDFDPAFSADGHFVYFASDRPGGAGGDDLYRVAVTRAGFGTVEHLGDEVNTPRNEWAPMSLGHTLLFSSDGHDGAGRMDLFTARERGARFGNVHPVPGDINTPADEFDATFLRDNRTIVFSRSRNLAEDAVALFVSRRTGDRFAPGVRLPDIVNTPGSSTYAPMLDWSGSSRITFTTRRPAEGPRAADLYRATLRVR